jgi:hypothetical protein
MPKLRQTFLRPQTSPTMTVPISPYTSHHYHQFFSAIYPYKPTQEPFIIYQLSTAPPAAWHSFFFLGGICEAIHPALRCVALSIALPVREWLEHGRLSPAHFLFLDTTRARLIWLHANFSSAAPLFVFLYCIFERSLINMLSDYFSGPTHHTPAHLQTHTHIHIHTSTPRFS